MITPKTDGQEASHVEASSDQRAVGTSSLPSANVSSVSTVAHEDSSRPLIIAL